MLNNIIKEDFKYWKGHAYTYPDFEFMNFKHYPTGIYSVLIGSDVNIEEYRPTNMCLSSILLSSDEYNIYLPLEIIYNINNYILESNLNIIKFHFLNMNVGYERKYMADGWDNHIKYLKNHNKSDSNNKMMTYYTHRALEYHTLWPKYYTLHCNLLCGRVIDFTWNY